MGLSAPNIYLIPFHSPFSVLPACLLALEFPLALVARQSQFFPLLPFDSQENECCFRTTRFGACAQAHYDWDENLATEGKGQQGIIPRRSLLKFHNPDASLCILRQLSILVVIVQIFLMNLVKCSFCLLPSRPLLLLNHSVSFFLPALASISFFSASISQRKSLLGILFPILFGSFRIAGKTGEGMA